MNRRLIREADTSGNKGNTKKSGSRYVKEESLPGGGRKRTIDGSNIPISQLEKMGYGRKKIG